MYTLKVMLTAIVTVIATLSFLFMIYNSHLVASAQGQPLDCSAIATKLGGKPIPIGDVCDVSVIRTSPQITGPNGTIFNKFLVANPIFEFTATPALPINMTGNNTTNTPSAAAASNQTVFVMGEFALIEPQLNSSFYQALAQNWNISAIHNHLLNESPDTIFVHADTRGNLDSITTHIKGLLLQIGIPSNATQTTTNATSTAGEGANQNTAVTGERGGQQQQQQQQQGQGPLEQMGEAISGVFGGGNNQSK
ncbi:MAG TPA: DUF1259 domain-containing protein [Nitrososphaeraceae archaeon]|nr:DUF1259 domain-containing protein [Nitrososphaeraceae archaeon]